MNILYQNLSLAPETESIAAQFNFSIQGLFHADQIQQEALVLTTQGLMVYAPDTKPWQIDFLSNARQHRRHYGGKETLVRACGIKSNQDPLTIIDATAGYGKDGFVLACAGAQVMLVERNPIMAALLDNALKRFYDDKVLSQNIHLTLHFGETLQFLDTQKELFDVIYWDPMHPTRQKSASVKKDMVQLQQWAQPETDPESLIKQSLLYAKDRVVLKWPSKVPSLPHLKPSFIYHGKTVRFEIFKIF
jgi:16S rRNA (guanine1516-N2)-methyltransferase